MDVCVAVHMYLIEHDEPKTVLTGKWQIDGASAMPFWVAGVFRSRWALPVPDDVDQCSSRFFRDRTSVPAQDGIADAVPYLAALVAALNLDGQLEDGGETVEGRTSAYDWPVYHAVWKESPINVAITAMLAEFAVLLAKMSGYTCSTARPPLTLYVGRCTSDRAERFVNLYVTPILGPQHSTKVHRLMCHFMNAVHMYGTINNGSAGINEDSHNALFVPCLPVGDSG